MQDSPANPQIHPPVPAALLALAPLHLTNHRRLRYGGDDLCINLDELADSDQDLLRDLYRQLTELLYTIADTSTSDAQKWDGVQGWIERYDLDKIIDEVRTIGLASYEQNPGEKLAKAMHDVRGGALGSLLGRLQLLGYLRAVSKGLNILFVQTRDHLKIMRNAVVGLDEPRRQADRRPKAHAMQLMLDKWQESVVGPQWHERPIHMEIDCHYVGALTECCLESAAIDRIFHNLANNAARHAADESLHMVVFPLPAPAEIGCLRFVLSNQVSEADAAWLLAQAGAGSKADEKPGETQDLLALFDPEVSSTGSGLGLKVVADFVSGAFGLHDSAEALHDRYVGAVLEGGRTFRVWFHWPTAHDDLPKKLDDYHHPAQSLSEP